MSYKTSEFPTQPSIPTRCDDSPRINAGASRKSLSERTRRDSFTWAPSEPSVKDIHCSIVVAVQHNPTVHTDMCPYTEAFVRTFLSTSAADLAGFVWVNFIDGDTSVRCFVLNQFYEACPSSIKDTFVQTALGCCTIVQVRAVLVLFDLWPLHHVVHREIFKDNCLKRLNQDSSLLMMEVSSLIANRLMRTAHKTRATFAAMALILPF